MVAVYTIGGQEVVPDTYTTATHAARAEATAYPVEDGAKLSDHVLRTPRTAALDCLFTPHADPSLLPSGPDRPAAAWAALLAARSAGTRIDLDVDGETYSPAVIVGLSRADVYDDGDALRIAVEVQEVTIAKSTLTGSKYATGVKHKGKQRDRGAKAPKSAAAKTATGATGQAATFMGAFTTGAGG